MAVCRISEPDCVHFKSIKMIIPETFLQLFFTVNIPRIYHCKPKCPLREFLHGLIYVFVVDGLQLGTYHAFIHTGLIHDFNQGFHMVILSFFHTNVRKHINNHLTSLLKPEYPGRVFPEDFFLAFREICRSLPHLNQFQFIVTCIRCPCPQ